MEDIKLKAYLAIHQDDLFEYKVVSNIKELMQKELPDVELYYPSDNLKTGGKSYKGDVKHILSSQIIIVGIDEEDMDIKSSNELGIFVGVLETLKAIEAQHTPKLVIGINMRRVLGQITGEDKIESNINSKFILGELDEWGYYVKTEKEVIQLIKDYISTH